MYEQKLKVSNAGKTEIQYDLKDLCQYIDQIKDLGCMTYSDAQKVYLPHGKDWIKSKIYMSLKKQAK